MNPDEMDYESSNVENDHDIEDDDEDDEFHDAHYILELETATDADEEDEEEDEDGDDGEEEGLSEEEEEEEEEEEGEAEVGGNVRFRLVPEDEDIHNDGDGVLRRHFGGVPFRVEILGLSGRGRGPRRQLLAGAEPVPNPEGQKLMREGQFGSEEWESYPGRPNPLKRKYPQYIRLLEREIGAYRGERARIGNQLLAQHLLPSTRADFVMHYDAKCYSGQFSQDGNFFYSCSQDFRVRMYDTSNPYDWKHYKTATYPGGRWTITDATLSPDNKMLAFSSIASTVYVSNTSSEMEETVALDFSANARHNRNVMDSRFGIWSIRFSGDGREMVAGANDRSLYVYDIETRTPILKMSGHQDDVNAVCFADVDSPHILFSGSDDTTIKVWDRRSMASGREAGVFCGHLEGLTYIDSKGDGRYVLSNGKDQTMKLWDIRKMMDPNSFDQIKRYNFSVGFDYRSDSYNYGPARHPNDSSVVTYRSHCVLRTLIRCHFSPPTSSGSRYVYTGSSDGKVYIYNLDATIASIIDVHTATFETRPWSEELSYGYGGWGIHGTRWKTCVRDASWHPNAGVITATSWNGYGAGTGSVTLHSWGGPGGEEDGGPVRLNCWGKRDPRLYGEGEGALGEEEQEESSSDEEETRERDRARVLRRRYL